jgi:LacI family transcriptional regulator, gluconate utilization system Gnt-I transcriptional repressor
VGCPIRDRGGAPRAAGRAVAAEPERGARRGHGRVTLRDVAQVAGVTSITVSRYLREPERVSQDTAITIRAALAATGYVPNRQAGQLASGQSRIVAALLPNLANSIFAETAQGLSDTLQAADHELLIASTGYSLEREEEQLRALLGWFPAAVVVTGRRHSPAARALLDATQASGTPVIEIWDRHEPEPVGSAGHQLPFTQIGFNHDDVGRAMAEHLLRAGHRRLAYVDSGVAEDYRAHERGQAFARAAQEAGAHVDVIAAPPGDAFDAGRSVVNTLLAPRKPEISAAAFANDHLASGALLEATRRKLAVPRRLALLGFGDFAIARQLEPGLSSVRLPRYEIGSAAARSLLAALAGGQPAASQSLAWQLVVRGSTAAAR